MTITLNFGAEFSTWGSSYRGGGLLSENCAVRLVRARTMTRGSGEAERRGSRNGTIGQKQLQ